MKNVNRKNSVACLIPGECGCEISPREFKARVTECVNMRAEDADRDSAVDGCLVQADGLHRVVTGQHRPLAVFRGVECEDAPDQSDVMLMESDYGDAGGRYLELVFDGEWTSVCEVGRVHCAVARPRGFTVMTDRGGIDIDFNDLNSWPLTNYAVSEACSGVAETWFEAIVDGEISEWTSPMEFSGIDFSRTDPQLGASAEKTIGAELVQAYGRLAEQAMAAGRWLQPVVAQLHAVNSDGERIYSAPPQLVAAPRGWQCTGEMSVDCSRSSDKLQVGAIEMRAIPFRLALHLEPEAIDTFRTMGAKALCVSVSPQVHVADGAAQLPWRLLRVSTQSPVLTVALPGATSSFASLDAQRFIQLQRIMASMTEVGIDELIVALPVDEDKVIISRVSGYTVDDESKMLSNLSKTTMMTTSATKAVADRLLDDISAPNSFVARTVAVSGDTLMWGDVTPIKNGTLNLSALCTQWVEGECEGVVRTTYSDGSSRSVGFSRRRRPTAISAMGYWGEADVRRVEVMVQDNEGRVWRAISSLGESRYGESGVRRIDNSLSAIEFESVGDSLPEPQRHEGEAQQGQRCAGAIVAARLAAPMVGLSAIECCHSPIKALTPVMRGHTSWDFSRSHFYAVSEAAVYAVSVNASKQVISAAKIDRRGATVENCVCSTPFGLMMLSRGELIKITASRADTIFKSTTAGQLAWDAPSERLFALSDNGLRVIDLAQSKWYDMPIPEGVETYQWKEKTHLADVDNRLWVSTPNGLYNLSSSQKEMPVAWTGVLKLPESYEAREIEVEMGADRFDGDIEMSAHSRPFSEGDRWQGCVVGRIHVKGVVNRPLRMKLWPIASMPGRRFVRIGIKGWAKNLVIQQLAIRN